MFLEGFGRNTGNAAFGIIVGAIAGLMGWIAFLSAYRNPPDQD